MNCHGCGKDFELPDVIAKDSECPHCAAYVRCCKNCRFYHPSAHNNCDEPQADLQADKEIGNVCDWFKPGVGAGPRPTKSKGDFDSLFK